jgi:hypothetical protein
VRDSFRPLWVSWRGILHAMGIVKNNHQSCQRCGDDCALQQQKTNANGARSLRTKIRLLRC